MDTVDVAFPPSPLAVNVYVVELEGLTLVEPCGVTAPTSGAIETLVALVVFQESFTDSPLLIVVRSAESEAVGCAGAGAGAGGGGGGAGFFLLQLAANSASREKQIRNQRTDGRY